MKIDQQKVLGLLLIIIYTSHWQYDKEKGPAKSGRFVAYSHICKAIGNMMYYDHGRQHFWCNTDKSLGQLNFLKRSWA